MSRVIIDGDSLTFYSSKDTLMESITNMEDRINNIFDVTKASGYIILLSDGIYFRHNIYPEYKLQRKKYREREKNYVRTLKNYLKDEYSAESVTGVEADDVVAYAKTMFPDAIVCSPDKDVLFQLSGKHFDYRYTLENKDTIDEKLIKGGWVEVTPEDAVRFFWMQCLMGDSTDNIPGIPGIGKVKSAKILQDHKTQDLPYVVLDEYLKYYGQSLGIYHYALNYRLLHLLSSEDDYIKEGIAPPNITENSFHPVQSNLMDSWG